MQPSHDKDPQGSAAQSAARFIGILSLETRFPRPLGDIGNPASFYYPVKHRVVAGASPQRVVREQAEGLLDAFVQAGQALVQEGAVGIATTCGFLTLFQAELTQALKVPVVTSSLMQWRNLNARMRRKKIVGIVTIDAQALTPAHLKAAHIPSDQALCPIQGMAPDSSFVHSILGNQPDLDLRKAEKEVVAAAQALVAARPEVGAILLECTNMAPYAEAVHKATDLPVTHALTMVDALAQACGLVKAPR